jgi:hypothetical protein
MEVKAELRASTLLGVAIYEAYCDPWSPVEAYYGFARYVTLLERIEQS